MLLTKNPENSNFNSTESSWWPEQINILREKLRMLPKVIRYVSRDLENEIIQGESRIGLKDLLISIISLNISDYFWWCQLLKIYYKIPVIFRRMNQFLGEIRKRRFHFKKFATLGFPNLMFSIEG